MGEIWGCRHMVEARHGKPPCLNCRTLSATELMLITRISFLGLHPLGIPCQRKSSTKFNTITRDVRTCSQYKRGRKGVKVICIMFKLQFEKHV